uniref:Neur_chan_LBD domain-containing protein n=1 Tax=Caenorhabditis japonica TaxID=281687 RepID=A0A8R1HZZ5_CAEJA
MKWTCLLFLIQLNVLIAVAANVFQNDCNDNEAIIRYFEETARQQKVEPEKHIIEAEYAIHDWNYVSINNQLEVDGLIKFQWKNPSFAFAHLKSCNQKVNFNGLSKMVWTPNTSLKNLISLSNQTETKQLDILEDGTIIITEKTKYVIPCESKIQDYPFGNTTCHFTWKCSDDKNVICQWKKPVVEIQNHYSNGNLLLKNFSSSIEEELQLALTFSFSENAQTVLLSFFLPALLFLIPPWLSLLLGPMAITRCCILTTSLLLISINCYEFTHQHPPPGGVNSILVWKLFSFVFVIAIIVELIVITLLASLGRSRGLCTSKSKKRKYELEPLYEELNDLRQRNTRKTKNCCRITALLCDITSFIFFGIVLGLFCYRFYTSSDVISETINNWFIQIMHIIRKKFI